MKSNLFFIFILSFSLIVYSCKPISPKQEVEALRKKIVEHTDILNKAIEDKKITEQEAVEIETAIIDLQKAFIQFDEKYKNDQDAQEIIQVYFKDNEVELEKIYEDYFISLMEVFNCEGSEKIIF
ncbi:MAG TPA: hypothetical protein PLW77_05160 [Bacteroidales bacterium]|nr:hypothetical protein [Bacteroidales bacterium]